MVLYRSSQIHVQFHRVLFSLPCYNYAEERQVQLFMPSCQEIALWGSTKEVEHFEGANVVETECDVAQADDSRFLANSKSSRKTGRRFDENGVFVVTCGRHGVPLRFFDIYKGESKKNILASVNRFVTMALA